MRTKNILISPSGTDGAGMSEQGSDLWRILRTMLSQKHELAALRLVSWDELRSTFGKSWMQVGAEMARVIRREIEARLGPEGICVRYNDASYLVISPEPGDLVLAELDGDFAITLAAQLVGIMGEANVIRVSCPIGMEEDGLIFEHTETPSRKTDTDIQGDDQENGSDLRYWRNEPELAAVEIALPLRSNEEGKSVPAKTARLILGDAEFSYFPLWNVRGNAIFSYLCEPFWSVGEGEIVPEEVIANQFTSHGSIHTLDLEVLHNATQELEANLDHEHLGKFLIPVHYETLAETSTAETYTEFLNQRIRRVREFVYFEIIRPPDQVLHDELSVAVQRVKPFGNGVLLRVKPGFQRFDHVPANEIFSLGIDLRTDNRPEIEIMEELEVFAAEWNARGIYSHVYGLKTISLSVAATCAGFDFIGSDAIALALREWKPDDYLLKPIDLFKSFLETQDN